MGLVECTLVDLLNYWSGLRQPTYLNMSVDLLSSLLRALQQGACHVSAETDKRERKVYFSVWRKITNASGSQHLG